MCLGQVCIWVKYFGSGETTGWITGMQTEDDICWVNQLSKEPALVSLLRRFTVVIWVFCLSFCGLLCLYWLNFSFVLQWKLPELCLPSLPRVFLPVTVWEILNGFSWNLLKFVDTYIIFVKIGGWQPMFCVQMCWVSTCILSNSDVTQWMFMAAEYIFNRNCTE